MRYIQKLQNDINAVISTVSKRVPMTLEEMLTVKATYGWGENGLYETGIFASKILQQVDSKIKAQNIKVICVEANKQYDLHSAL